MRKLEARGPVTGRLARTPGFRALVRCLHVNGFGPRHWHEKGTVPGYKGSGYFCQCLSWCKACVPC